LRPLDPVIFDDGVGEQLAAHGLDLRHRRRFGESSSISLPARTSFTPEKPSPSSAWWMALPCGSSTPFFKVT
jgi:hypothetical protein